MAGRTRAAWEVDLVWGAARFAESRRRREVGARIPTALWDLAVELAQRHGASRTAQAVRVLFGDFFCVIAAGSVERWPVPTLVVLMSITIIVWVTSDILILRRLSRPR